MLECETIIKKWGNSFGIVLPKEIIRKNRMNSQDKVHVVITKVTKSNAAKKLWGALAHWETPTEELERQIDREFDIPV